MNKTLTAALIVIGIIIIIILLSPRYRTVSSYSYRGEYYPVSYGIMEPQVVRTYGHPITVKGVNTYSYPVTKTTTIYKYIFPNTNHYPEGCTAYTAYSATTGWPCR